MAKTNPAAPVRAACVLEGCIRISAFQHRGCDHVRRPPRICPFGWTPGRACVSSYLRARILTFTSPTLNKEE